MNRSRRKVRRNGVAIVYIALVMSLMLGFAALAVDFARIQVDKTQARSTADGAALYAASGLVGGTAASVEARAVTAAADNKIENASVVVNPTQDVAFGVWDSASGVFSPVPASSVGSATAVKVTVHLSASRGTAVPMAFASVLGFPTKDIQATAIASIGTVSSQTVPAYASPWLAGMPAGSSIPATGGNTIPAVAPLNSPISFATSGGNTLHFTETSGSTSWVSTSGNGQIDSAAADGDTNFIANQAAVNGINTTYAPLNAMMGIFLSDAPPSPATMAGSLDFSTAAERNFSTLSPQLQQVFFIGDGLDASGNLQSFIAPPGATRLFVGIMDEEGWWWDNVGTIQFVAVQGTTPVLVQ